MKDGESNVWRFDEAAPIIEHYRAASRGPHWQLNREGRARPYF
jgi:hypothetical protein